MEFLKSVNIDKIRNAAEDVINQAKPKTEVEARVYEALSHKNWGSSSTLMNEIARDTFDYERYNVVMKIMWESVENQRPAAWRVVFKGLTLLEHLVKNGSERCVDDGRNHSHILRSLNNFNYYEGTVDRGVGVREKSKQIVELLADNERIREERTKAKQLREKFGNIGSGISSSNGGTYAGYGKNDIDDGGSRYNGSSGYGNSGIGAGGYSDSGIGSDNGYGNSNFGEVDNYSGRYSDTNATSANNTGASSPTFANLPSEKKEKKKSKKSKKKKDKSKSPDKVIDAPPADLLAFDDPGPASTTVGDDFDAFNKGATTSDSFDAFQEHTGTASTSNTTPTDSFDAFGTPSESKQAAFDAFSSPPPPSATTSQPVFDAFGGSTSSVPATTINNNVESSINDMFGSMSVGVQGQTNMKVLQSSPFVSGGNTMSMHQQVNNNDDDFGDFEDADKEKSSGNGDPLSNLISLDGLSKNKKQDDKVNQSIAFNGAAKAQMANGLGVNSGVSQSIAFEGVDGLTKAPMRNAMPSTTKPTNIPIMGGMNNTNLDMFANNQQNMGMRGNLAQGMGNMMNSMNGNGSRMVNGMNGGGMSMTNGNTNMMNASTGNMGSINMVNGNQQQNGMMMSGDTSMRMVQQTGNMMDGGGGMGMQQQRMPGHDMMGGSGNMMGNFGQTMGGHPLGSKEQMGGW